MKFNLLLVLGLLLTSCSTQLKSDIADQKVNIKDIVNDPEVTLVDVRIPEEYQESSAHNAINIPLADIENHIDFLKKQKKVVVFCNRGIQAGKALDVLKKNGLDNVYSGTNWKNVKAIQEENRPNTK